MFPENLRFSKDQEACLEPRLSDEEFTRRFRQLDRTNPLEALELLEGLEASRRLGLEDRSQRVRAARVVLGEPGQRVYR